MSSPLTDVLPALWRKRLYALYALAGVGIGAVQVAYASLPGEQPTALTVTLAVYAYLGIGLGLTAASNVEPSPPADQGQADVGLLLLVLTFIGVVLLLFGIQLD